MNELKISRHIVAFIDILGSSKAIAVDSQSSLKIIHSAYEGALKGFNSLFDNKKIKPTVKIFSDNIVVAVPCPKGFEKPCFLAVTMMSGIIQVEFLKKKYLTRGGITIGDYFCDDVMMWGNALVKAHHLESQVAVYPRVIIDPDLIGELKLAIEEDRTHCKEWIRQDKDRLFYVDYLNKCLQNAWILCLGMLDISDIEIGKEINNVKVCQKWLWLKSYLHEKLPETLEEGVEKPHA